MKLQIFSENEILEKLLAKAQSKVNKYDSNYLAMYSTWYGGIVTNPALMMLPIDDHMVHRGDGVFEAMKFVGGGIYLLDQHIDRLFLSASKLSLPCPLSKSELKEVILKTTEIAYKISKSEFILRLYLSRGPGSFGTNPYDSIGSQVFLIITKMARPSEDKYKTGVSVGKSVYPIKSGWFPQVKSCNYLPNVLMKKEAVDRKLDFTVSFNDEGKLAESSTENMILINQANELVHPRLDFILRGTTMARMFDITEEQKVLPVRRQVDITEEDILNAKGVFMIGTTLDILPVSSYEGKKLPIHEKSELLLKLLRADQSVGSQFLTLLA